MRAVGTSLGNARLGEYIQVLYEQSDRVGQFLFAVDITMMDQINPG